MHDQITLGDLVLDFVTQVGKRCTHALDGICQIGAPVGVGRTRGLPVISKRRRGELVHQRQIATGEQVKRNSMRSRSVVDHWTSPIVSAGPRRRACGAANGYSL